MRLFHVAALINKQLLNKATCLIQEFNMNTLKRIRFIIAMFMSISICANGQDSAELNEQAKATHNVIAKTQLGLVKGGSVLDTKMPVNKFLGIPYAQAPIANLRWQGPKSATQWRDVLDATQYAPDCMQTTFPGDSAPLKGSLSEDCLYLNIWAPAQDITQKRPVMVWIHGGGFVNGGSSAAIYSGQSFAESGVVFVSFNYRLGRFGFFAHPGLSEQSKNTPLGNYGLMDQIAALKWVKNNITHFGGDADNVTLFGESAGGRSVNFHMLSPQSKGLFHKAIVQSGGGRSDSTETVVYLNKKGTKGNPSAEDAGIQFARSVGINTNDIKALAKLRALPAEKVLSGLNMMNANTPTYSGPMIDSSIVLTSDEEGFAQALQTKVPLFIGSTDFEWGFLKDYNPKGAIAIATETIESVNNKAQFTKAYAPFVLAKNGELNYPLLGSMIFGDKRFVEPARYIASKASMSEQPTWLYRFNYVPSHLKGKVDGAYHATEIPFVFNTLAQNPLTSQNDFKIASAMHAAWVRFAKYSNPSPKQGIAWPNYNAKDNRIIEFNENGSEVKQDPLENRLNEITNLISQ